MKVGTFLGSTPRLIIVLKKAEILDLVQIVRREIVSKCQVLCKLTDEKLSAKAEGPKTMPAIKLGSSLSMKARKFSNDVAYVEWLVEN